MKTLRDTSFFWRGSGLLAAVLGVVLAVGNLAGRAYKPQPLGPSESDVRASRQFIAIFGGSRVEAGIVPAQLADELSVNGARTRVEAYAGGGWDMLHTYMLSLLSKDTLRPGVDSVLLDVAAWSVNDSWGSNRLGAIRPAVAATIAALPEEPMETRLDLLLGGVSGLYRYRVSIQGAIGARLSGALDHLRDALERHGGGSSNNGHPAFSIITKPGKNFAIQQIRGDQEAFHIADRRQLESQIRELKTGGFKLHALERAIAVLRARGIRVYLVQLPTTRWFDARMSESAGTAGYRNALVPLAAVSQARLLTAWPEEFHDPSRFWDEMHMTPDGAREFTHALAQAIAANSASTPPRP